MASQLKVWNWNNYKWGLSDNPYIGAPGSFQNGSRNIDTESEPGWVKLSSKPTAYVTTTGRVNFILNGNRSWVDGIYTFCHDKAIYLNTTNTVTAGSTIATNLGIIYHAEIINVSGTNWIIALSSTGVHQISTDLSSTVNYSIHTITSSTQKASVKYKGSFIFVSGNVLYKLDTSLAMTTLFTGEVGETFTGLTVFQDNYKIYSSVNWQDGRQYIVNFIGTNLYTTEWAGLPVLKAANIGPIDYIVTWSTSTFTDLYAVSGTQRQQIKGNLEWVSERNFTNGVQVGGVNIMSRRDDIFLSGTTFSTTKWAIFKYGAFYPGVGDTLTCPYGADDTEVTALMTQGAYLYFGTKVWDVFKVQQFELSTPPIVYYYATSGDLISLIFNAGNPYTYKTLAEIRISYDCDTSANILKGGSFELYARTKNSQSFTQIGSTYTKTDVDFVQITENNIIAAGFSKWTQIEFKLKLIAWTSGWNNVFTPLITGVQVFYYDNIDN